MNVLDLFSGIGGFSLGLERAGMKTVAFCEINDYCRRVLAKHWPSVPCFTDVKDIHGPDNLAIDVICGGFPCQDISLAGLGAGLAGVRSGLWFEFARIIGGVRPRYAIIENVAALRSRGLDTVLGSLAEIGYDAEWHCIPAAAVGAPHRRDRIWIVAYPDSDDGRPRGPGRSDPGGAGQPVAERTFRDTDSAGLAFRQGERGYPRPKLQAIERTDWWAVEPDVGRVANGIPARVDRLRSLGNSIVPEIAYQIGRAIMEAQHHADVHC